MEPFPKYKYQMPHYYKTINSYSIQSLLHVTATRINEFCIFNLVFIEYIKLELCSV